MFFNLSCCTIYDCYSDDKISKFVIFVARVFAVCVSECVMYFPSDQRKKFYKYVRTSHTAISSTRYYDSKYSSVCHIEWDREWERGRERERDPRLYRDNKWWFFSLLTRCCWSFPRSLIRSSAIASSRSLCTAQCVKRLSISFDNVRNEKKMP